MNIISAWHSDRDVMSCDGWCGINVMDMFMCSITHSLMPYACHSRSCLCINSFQMVTGESSYIHVDMLQHTTTHDASSCTLISCLIILYISYFMHHVVRDAFLDGRIGDRECLFPEIPRVSHVGANGYTVSMSCVCVCVYAHELPVHVITIYMCMLVCHGMTWHAWCHL